MLENLKKYQIILGSASPRRQELLKTIGLEFQIRIAKNEETYPIDLCPTEIAKYLASQKADEIAIGSAENELIITADTIVVHQNKILNKPKDAKEAKQMLEKLSAQQHEVITGVCLKTKQHKKIFASSTKVYFKKLEPKEIKYYIEQYQPFDKAGAYGIQEWIGIIGIEKIEGSYVNVVGLPIERLYQELIHFD